jgi:hypothetical protein
MLADMKDSAKNKMSSEEISDLKIRVYDNNTAIATYTDTYASAVNIGPRLSSVPTLLFARMVCGKKSQAIVPSPSRRDSPHSIQADGPSFRFEKRES